MTNNFNQKYDFEISKKYNTLHDKDITLEERQILLDEIKTKFETNKNESIKQKNDSTIVKVEINEKYKKIANKSPYHILACKFKCYKRLFEITYKNYYEDEFTTFRNSTYTGFSIFIISQIVVNFTFTYHPLKKPLLWIFSISSVGLVFINWRKNIEELIALTDENGYRKEIKTEIRDINKDISLYNPFIKLN